MAEGGTEKVVDPRAGPRRLGGALILLAGAMAMLVPDWKGWGALAGWPIGAFVVVGVAYLAGWKGVFGKRPDGRLGGLPLLLLFPYLALAWGIWRLGVLLSPEDATNELSPGILIGRRLGGKELPEGVATVVDLTAEFTEPRAIRTMPGYRPFPILDGGVPEPEAVKALLEELDFAGGSIYIHCAQGHGRTALVAALLLMHRGTVAGAEEALEAIRKVRPRAKLSKAQRTFVGL